MIKALFILKFQCANAFSSVQHCSVANCVLVSLYKNPEVVWIQTHLNLVPEKQNRNRKRLKK